ncbi:MAG: YncE family protein [Sporolactobacillus sp.]
MYKIELYQKSFSQSLNFKLPLKIPTGFILNSTGSLVNVTWDTNQLRCKLWPCQLRFQNAYLADSEHPGDSDQGYAVQIKGKIPLLISVSPVLNRNGKGNAAASERYRLPIKQFVQYTRVPDCPIDFNQLKIENMRVTPGKNSKTCFVSGTIYFVPRESPIYAFVVKEGSKDLSVIDTAAMVLQQTIHLEYLPRGVKAAPDRKSVFVLHPSDNRVSVINEDSLDVAYLLNIENPVAVSFSSDSRFAYVLSGNIGKITVVDSAAQTISERISFSGSGYSSLAIDPSGQYAFVINASAWSILRVHLITKQIEEKPTASDYPSVIAISSTENFAYILEEAPGLGSLIEVIDLSAFRRIASISIGYYVNPFITFSPDGSLALLGERDRDILILIDTSNHRVKSEKALNKPRSAAYTPDQKTIYVAQTEQNTVTVLRSLDYSILQIIPLSESPLEVTL